MLWNMLNDLAEAMKALDGKKSSLGPCGGGKISPTSTPFSPGTIMHNGWPLWQCRQGASSPHLLGSNQGQRTSFQSNRPGPHENILQRCSAWRRLKLATSRSTKVCIGSPWRQNYRRTFASGNLAPEMTAPTEITHCIRSTLSGPVWRRRVKTISQVAKLA